MDTLLGVVRRRLEAVGASDVAVVDVGASQESLSILLDCDEQVVAIDLARALRLLDALGVGADRVRIAAFRTVDGVSVSLEMPMDDLPGEVRRAAGQ
ncbi:protein of unknown function [Candidatus Hydrogenisulfobacillus filiaventi]|uniref:Uncharacterized protein n=1 Tax=Candidatus Hydrogenisulfobacillus filiaventi TaxID=2707344 RepID=A0A6F8ZJB2_9FIRM|nr:protein of unknown function [Candidatus Hydrogenisulfobacillus filiaventi]